MQKAGVRPVVDASSISVVGLVEVIQHIPRVYGEFRKLTQAAAAERPDLAILTDSPDFHLRLAKRLKALGIPVLYLVAPQVWAWRKGRLPAIRRTVDQLLCIFPFEPDFFRAHGIDARYIGHPLTRMVKPSAERSVLRSRYKVPESAPLIALLPGSRKGEIERHLPLLVETVRKISAAIPEKSPHFTLALPHGSSLGLNLKERFSEPSIQVLEGQTWDVLACAEIALAASGTVTVEAMLLGTPLVAFYRVNNLSWMMGRHLVKVPFFSMVNLIAGRSVVPELIQSDFTADRLASEALRLLQDEPARAQMRAELRQVAETLQGTQDPLETAAALVEQHLKEELVHV